MKDEKKIPMWKVKAEIKIKKGLQKVGDGAKAVGTWAVTHPMEALTVASSVAGVVNVGMRVKNKHDEKVRIETRFWDPRTGTYSWSKRRLKPGEKRMLETRSRNGELKSDVLYQWGLLKY